MDKKKTITIKDIAKAVGVDASTVSRALNKGAKTPPSQEVVDKIIGAAEALGYRRNRMASGLRTNRSWLIGVMVTDLSDPLFPPIVRGIESVMEPLGYNSLIVNSDDDAERAARLLGVLNERGVDGIISGGVFNEDPATLDLYRKGLPIVTFNRRILDGSVPSVVSNEQDGFSSVINYLYSLGHKRIGLVCGPQNRSTGLLRMRACYDALRELQIEPPPDAVSFARSWEETEGARGVAAILKSSYDPTAIVCSNDRLAIGAIRELRIRGISCPQHISITGFNDTLNVDLIDPPLTTVRVRKQELGAIAARTLLDLLESHESARGAQFMVPVELIVRRSSAVART